jgi:hypothetical protein
LLLAAILRNGLLDIPMLHDVSMSNRKMSTTAVSASSDDLVRYTCNTKHHRAAFGDDPYDLAVALRKLRKDSGESFHVPLASVRHVGVMLDMGIADVSANCCEVVLIEELLMEGEHYVAVFIGLHGSTRGSRRYRNTGSMAKIADASRSWYMERRMWPRCTNKRRAGRSLRYSVVLAGAGTAGLNSTLGPGVMPLRHSAS